MRGTEGNLQPLALSAVTTIAGYRRTLLAAEKTIGVSPGSAPYL